jgi:DNA-binding SARP family transcriptional activator
MTDSFATLFVPKEVRGLAALVLMLGSGSFEEIRSLGFEVGTDAPAKLSAFCPQLEIDLKADRFWTDEQLPTLLDTSIIEALLSVARAGERQDMSDQERCFERLSALAAHMIEAGLLERSISLLKLTGQILNVNRNPSLSYQTEWQALRSNAFNTTRSTDESPTVPHLRVKLFGDMEVELDGKPLAKSSLTRGLVRSLFCLLVLNQGKGLARETMLEWLWPGRDQEKALPSFYNLWSKLGKSLPGERESSYYFTNDSGVLRINPRYVSSDVGDFDRLARAVLFEQGSIDERFAAIDRLEQLYTNDILAGCTAHPLIIAAQVRYHEKLIDVFLSASALHLSQENNTMALWYARRALDTDPKREETYRVLMNTQEACGQRTQAIKTYHECRHFLDEELGLSPSKQLKELYLNLIADGE